MKCRRAAGLLCFDVGGDLGPRQHSAVADHLAICPACRGFRDELSATLETARSLEVPALERGGEELRRRVWREIRKDRDQADTRKAEGIRLVIAAAGCSAALLLSLSFFVRRPAVEPGRLLPHAPPSAIASAPAPPDPARKSPPTLPVDPVASARASRPQADARESGITRIEFRTPNQVRIIWLVGQEAPETSPAQPPGPKQEVS